MSCCSNVKTDPLLGDLHSDLTLDELNSILSLEHGESMILYVHKADGQIISEYYDFCPLVLYFFNQLQTFAFKNTNGLGWILGFLWIFLGCVWVGSAPLNPNPKPNRADPIRKIHKNPRSQAKPKTMGTFGCKCLISYCIYRAIMHFASKT
jgi:hypothetical protein